ncbi:MAG: hypothetical protein Q9225_000686 [Loekoesia sp. 1 TL-2023]
MANHQQIANSRSSVSEDGIPTELDEPPDDQIRFSRVPPLTNLSVAKQYPIPRSTTHSRKASLLTQGLLISPDSTPSSDAEAPFLTSDGGLTSPARTNSPSPPLPATHPRGLATIASHDLITSGAKAHQKHPTLPPKTDATDSSPATDIEVGLGRKRCIKFACGRQAAAPPEDSHAAETSIANQGTLKSGNPSKRPCMLKFVCPMKPPPQSSGNQQSSRGLAGNDHVERSLSTTQRPPSPSCAEGRRHRDSESTIKNGPMGVGFKSQDANRAVKPLTFNRPDLEGSEATRFHEFAGPYNGEDEWVNEQTAHRKKITVNDTLQKENAIRKLGEEAEEEAMEEETYDESEDMNDRLSSDDGSSDGGNESDDEEGFAESDEESEMGSDYQFWTPGLTTAATSADHLEHFRPPALRKASNSSIESMIHVKNAENVPEHVARRGRKLSRSQPMKMRPGTPDLPDSTDFVCGTLDEDRPLEAAYLSCLEERRRSKHPVVPQDIDPSFPTSDPEDEGDEDDEANSASTGTSDEPHWVMGRPDHSDEEQIPSRCKTLSRRNTKSPMPSPRRMRSPPPQKRSVVRRSPAPLAIGLSSCERSSSNSLSGCEDKLEPMTPKPSLSPHALTNARKVIGPHLPRRPNLTHTASLPRTPNPFWAPCRQRSGLSSPAASPKSKASDVRCRGPIDIVTGLEKKRQRRKEKFWRQHYRNGGREKERRCQPGKGAERMRELGLEMAGKNKGQLPHVQLMLSI